MSQGTETEGDSIANIARDLRALVEWERTIGGGGFPVVRVPPVQSQQAAAGLAPRHSSPATSGQPHPAASHPAPSHPAPSHPAASHPAASHPAAVAAEPPSMGAESVAHAPSGAMAEAGDARQRLHVLAQAAASCTQCELHKERTKSVFARGSATARLVFVGEGPGYNEDQQGEPFVGKAGKLLDRMVGAMGLRQDQIYICNVVKCRPPNNRTPKPDEAARCSSFLRQQLDIVKPDVMVALGRTAAEALNVAEPGQRGWRGQWGKWNKIPVMTTYHPAFLLRSPQFKRPVWEDLQKVMARLGLEAPPAG